MKLSPKEKAALRAAFRRMSFTQKLDYIWEYYKLPILVGLAALAALCSVLHRQLTKKETVLSLALVNVDVGADLQKALTEDFLLWAEADPKKQEVTVYPDLYVSDNANAMNHEYAYASQMKLSGAVSAQLLDLALMNREAYDILSQKGFLLELSSLAGLPDALKPLLAENEVVLSDNALEVILGEAEEEERVTQRDINALAVEGLPLFQAAGFDGELYLGVIANSVRPDAAAAYLNYLTGNTAAVTPAPVETELPPQAPENPPFSGGGTDSAPQEQMQDTGGTDMKKSPHFYINDTELSVRWEENESARALLALAASESLTVQMSMYGGFEQVGALGASLPRNDAQTTTHSGDIVLYSGNQLVIFYGSNSWAYTRLGRIADATAEEMTALLGSGNVTVSLVWE